MFARHLQWWRFCGIIENNEWFDCTNVQIVVYRAEGPLAPVGGISRRESGISNRTSGISNTRRVYIDENKSCRYVPTGLDMCLAALDIFLRNSICALWARDRATPDKPKFEARVRCLGRPFRRCAGGHFFWDRV